MTSVLISSHQVLSVGQLEALGPDNAAMVTDAQKAKLSKAKLAALDRALVGSDSESADSGSSKTPVIYLPLTAALETAFVKCCLITTSHPPVSMSLSLSLPLSTRSSIPEH